ncbi:MAG: GNAT family N-acetyltransferase [Bacteriovoracaceae bacterium]|nr:GNAT family N-acetyltransferase [Bacteriovoracaceae bacterium]
MNKSSFDNLTFTFVTRDEFTPVFRELRPTVFSENNDVDYSTYWSDEEHAKFKDLQAMCKTEVRSYLLCKDGEKIVGWSFGFQKDAEEFYMVNSAVLPDYRNRGIYKHLLELIIEKARKEGFQIISSTHHASNNAILIPKLKFGFKIMGMRLHPRFGTLIDLHYYTNEKVGQVLDYRTGYTKDLPEK